MESTTSYIEIVPSWSLSSEVFGKDIFNESQSGVTYNSKEPCFGVNGVIVLFFFDEEDLSSISNAPETSFVYWGWRAGRVFSRVIEVGP